MNVYAPNKGALKYIKQILTDTKEENNKNTIIVEDFNTPLIWMDRPSRQKISKSREILNNIVEKSRLIDIFKTL